MIVHRLGGSGKDAQYFISCLKDKPHNIEDYHFTRFFKKTTCKKCIGEKTQRLYHPHKAAITKQINEHVTFKAFLQKEGLLRKFKLNCYRQEVKQLGFGIDLIRNTLDWSDTFENREFWSEASNNWLRSQNAK